jgi:hypothetical protein
MLAHQTICLQLIALLIEGLLNCLYSPILDSFLAFTSDADAGLYAVLDAAGKAAKKAEIMPTTRTCTIFLDITVTRFIFDFAFDES